MKPVAWRQQVAARKARKAKGRRRHVVLFRRARAVRLLRAYRLKYPQTAALWPALLGARRP